jgi:hypothetical protein
MVNSIQVSSAAPPRNGAKAAMFSGERPDRSADEGAFWTGLSELLKTSRWTASADFRPAAYDQCFLYL